MRVAICDDQPELLEDLKNKIQKSEGIAEIDSFYEAKKLIEAVKDKRKYDIIFMNIELGRGINGIDVAASMGNPQLNVVFVTAFPLQYIENAMNGNFVPAGFLIKPVEEDKLKAVIEKIKNQAVEYKKTIDFTVNGKSLVFHVNEINFFEGRLHKMAIHFVDGSEIEVTRSLNESKCSFPDKFIEVHKSYVVNPDNVFEFSSNNVIMKNGESVPASRSRGPAAKQMFLKYIAEKV